MDFSRSLSSKRSSAAIELCPCGLTERQMLQLALEESKNAALAAQAAAGKSEETSDEENSDSDSDDGSSAHRGKTAGKARRAKAKAKPRAQQASDHKYACSTPRKRAKLELAEIRTATSSENSKASRSTQLRDLMGSAFGDHQVQAPPCHGASMAGDNRESDNSEHQSGSGEEHSICRQPAQDSASPSVKVESAEGAGETEMSPRQGYLKNSESGLTEDCKPGVAVKEESAGHTGKSVAEDHKPPSGLKPKKKSGLAGKRSALGTLRPPALTIPNRDSETGSAEAEACKKGRGPGSRAPRSASRNTGSKGSRWASPLNSPVGASARRLRSAVVEEMKHNIEGIEAFAWRPQTPARARASALSGACALLSKLSSHSSGSLLREGSQVLTPSFSAGQLSDVSMPRGSPQPGTPRWLSPISEVGSSPLQQLGLQLSYTGEVPCALQNAASAELASKLEAVPGSPPITPPDQAQAEFATPKRPTPTLEFPKAARDASSTPTLLLPPAAPSFGSCLPLKKLHSGKLHLTARANSTPGLLHVDVGSLARQASADLKARHDLETKRLELSAEGSGDGAGPSKPCTDTPAMAAAHGSRLGKALKAVQLGMEVPPKASFQDSCGRLLKPFECAKDAPAWKAPQTLRSSPSGGCLSISPHLAKQREQRNLQNTWDDLLARQALEASAAEHLAEWAKASLPSEPAAQA